MGHSEYRQPLHQSGLSGLLLYKGVFSHGTIKSNHKFFSNEIGESVCIRCKPMSTKHLWVGKAFKSCQVCIFEGRSQCWGDVNLYPEHTIRLCTKTHPKPYEINWRTVECYDWLHEDQTKMWGEKYLKFYVHIMTLYVSCIPRPYNTREVQFCEFENEKQAHTEKSCFFS